VSEEANLAMGLKEQAGRGGGVEESGEAEILDARCGSQAANRLR
jgi:hypothetical protein